MDTSTPYCGPVPAPDHLWQSWNLDPPLLVALTVLLGAGVWGAASRSALLVAWGGLVLAFVSPLCALTTALFSARAVHHLLLLGIVAPALAVAWPRRTVSGAAALVLVGGALVLWHLPPVYTMAWDSPALYWVMQVALILPGWAIWTRLLGADGQHAEAPLVQAVLLGALAAVMGLIAAVLTFAPRILFVQHAIGAFAWGMDPLIDQQLAGLIMWVPGMIPLALLAALAARRAWQQATTWA